MVLMVAIVAATYFLFPQLADLPAIAQQVRDAQWGWVPLVVVVQAVTYVGAGLGLAGAVPRTGPDRRPDAGTGGGVVRRQAGARRLGGMALNVRLLQKQGVDRAVAVSGVGLSTVAGVVAHVSLIGIFLVWAGRRAFGSFRLPDVHWFLIGGARRPGPRRHRDGPAVHAADAARAARAGPRPGVRRGVRGGPPAEQGGPPARRLRAHVARQPAWRCDFAVVAFGGGLSFATVGAVYLVGSAIASAAPTPGGLGRDGGGADRRARGRRPRQRRRRARRVPVPAGDVLVADPARAGSASPGCSATSTSERAHPPRSGSAVSPTRVRRDLR